MTGSIAGAKDNRQAFAVLWFGQFVAVGGLTTVVPVLPFYLAGLGVPSAAVPWWTSLALAAPAAAQFVSGPLWGRIGDRYGRKPMVVRAQLGLAVALGLMAWAETAAQFVVFRFVQGLFGGVVSANAAFAGTMAREEHQGRTFGGLMSATAAGSLAGPLVGSAVAVGFGLDVLFICVATLMVLSALLSLCALREATTLSGKGEAAPTTEDLSVRGGARLLWRDRYLRRMLVGGLAAQSGVYALVVIFAPRIAEITDSVRTATLWIGVLQAVTWAATLVGGMWWGHRNDRGSPQRNFAFAALGCGLAVALQAVPGEPGWLTPLRLLQGFCFAALLPSIQHLVSRGTPFSGRGTCLALTMSVLGFGQVLGPLFGAAVAGLGHSAWQFCGLGLLFVGAAALAAARPRPWRATLSPVPSRSDGTHVGSGPQPASRSHPEKKDHMSVRAGRSIR
ncbi:MFS transporter [Streptomyces bluensis]|uniref:MFS transporter n=1 Tax=Streptomyces bluensis TaxID=33897 RepID=UPI003331D38D